MKTLTLTLITFLTSLSVVAAPKKPARPLTLGAPIIGGTGCPAGQANFRINSANEITILMGDFSVSGLAAASFDRKNCSARASVKIAKGYKLVIVEAANIGAQELKAGDTISMNQDISIVGEPKNSLDLVPKLIGNKTTWRNAIVGSYLVNTACNKGNLPEVMLTVDTTLLLRKSASSSNSFARVESTKFKLQAVKCK